MQARDLDRYIGIPYDAERMDCADLAVLLQAELFGKVLRCPGRRQRMAAPAALIEQQITGPDAMAGELAYRIDRDDLQDGDICIMRSETMHIGTLFLIAGQWWVLHAFANIGHSTMHRLADLPGLRMKPEGFYRWK